MLEFQGQAPGACVDSYTWDLQNPSEPDTTLAPLSALVCINYNLKDSKVHDTHQSDWGQDEPAQAVPPPLASTWLAQSGMRSPAAALLHAACVVRINTFSAASVRGASSSSDIPAVHPDTSSTSLRAFQQAGAGRGAVQRAVRRLRCAAGRCAGGGDAHRAQPQVPVQAPCELTAIALPPVLAACPHLTSTSCRS